MRPRADLASAAAALLMVWWCDFERRTRLGHLHVASTI